MTIQDNIDTIRGAVNGKDVREAIAQLGEAVRDIPDVSGSLNDLNTAVTNANNIIATIGTTAQNAADNAATTAATNAVKNVTGQLQAAQADANQTIVDLDNANKQVNKQLIDAQSIIISNENTLAQVREQSENIQSVAAYNQDQIDKGTVATQDQINSISSSLEEKANEVDLQTQKLRIDNLSTLGEGSTTGDAELIDARTVNGTTYTNLGGAVRALSSGEAINRNVLGTERVNFIDISTDNLADYRNSNIVDYSSYSPSTGAIVSKTTHYRTLAIDVSTNTALYGYYCGDIYFFDENDTYISVSSDLSGTVFKSTAIPSNAKTVIISVPYEKKNNAYCSFVNSQEDNIEYSFPNLKIKRDNIKSIDKFSLLENEGEKLGFYVTDVQNTGVKEQDYITKYNSYSYRVGAVKASTNSQFKIVLDRATKWTTLGMWIYIEEKWKNKLNEYGFSIRVADNTSDYTNNYKYTKKRLYSGWNFIRFCKSECTIEGTAPEYAKTLFFFLSDASGASTSDTFCVLYVDSVIKNYRLKPSIAIVHDGMWGGTKANGIYDKYVSNRIPITVCGYDWDDYTLWDSQYETDGITKQELYNEAMRLTDTFGFELGLYGGYRSTPVQIREGTDVKTMTENIENLKNTLTNVVPYEPVSYVCSMGVYNNKIEKCLKNNGIKIARTTENTYLTSTLDEDTPMFIGTMGGSKDITLEQYKSWIDLAIEGGYCCTIFSHNVTDTATRNVDVTTTVWNGVLDYIIEKKNNGEILTLTMGDMYRKLVRK